MHEAFWDDLHLSKQNQNKLTTVNSIIEEYRQDNLVMTLRQLYYQLVSRAIIPNKDLEYKKLGKLLTKGRMAGHVDWNAIEDRIRVPCLPYWVHDPADALTDTIDQYRLDRQEGQNNYLELWVEKDALSGVLRRITDYYHIRLLVNRGYTSTTAIHDSAMRLLNQSDDGKETCVLYLGDHDPSGLDMVRDIRERLKVFGCYPEITAIALTTEQINKYRPPKNPAKFKDPRAKDYIRKFGRLSWEVDALNPRILSDMVKENIESRIDMDLFAERLAQEEADKEKLQRIAKNFKEKNALNN